VRIEDESAKFNINTIISPDGVKKTYDSFVRLLTLLNLDVKIADRIADWIDVNSNAQVSGSESGAKNAYLDSTDELRLIHGIAKEDYDKLLPYITVHGPKDNLYINVNRAKIPVLRSMSYAIKEETAKSIINQREFMPFGDANDFTRRTDIFQLDAGIYAETEGNDFLMQVAASSGGLKRIIETVLNIDKATIEYWKEY
jgi:type II secretory pathway component PulK